MNIFGPPRKQKRKHYLVEFRAGKMKMDENNWVFPDKRKGLVYIHQTTDGMMHFCWKDRDSGNVEDDLIVFPNETSFKRLNQCKTGRVYLLQFNNNRKLFLWMQEPLEENDSELCQKVNDLLNQNATNADKSKALNITDFTNLLGELHNMGALNDLDILEILGSQLSADSDISAQNTNPFPIRNTPSASTFAEAPIEPLRPFIPQEDSSYKMSNFDGTVDSKISSHEFCENTLIELSKNHVFRSRILFEGQTDENKVVDIHSKEFKNAEKKFSDMLTEENSAKNILKEMNIPDIIVTKNSDGELEDVKKALDDYFNSQNKKVD